MFKLPNVTDALWSAAIAYLVVWLVMRGTIPLIGRPAAS